jgi:hypothetical protein
VTLVGYLVLIAAVVWILSSGPGSHIPAKLEILARAFAAALDAAFVALGVALLARGEATRLGVALLTALTIGALVHLSGVTLWRARTGQTLRVVGWTAMACALVVPTTISLALPLLALLAPTLGASPPARPAS